jgi:hypothetical protein
VCSTPLNPSLLEPTYLGLLAKSAQGRRGGVEDGPVALARMGAREGVEFPGQGERDEEAGAGQELFELLFEPLFGLVPLALGTMPVAAGDWGMACTVPQASQRYQACPSSPVGQRSSWPIARDCSGLMRAACLARYAGP